jgi:ribosomal-protein-alanine N-acetyltransferase
MYPVRLIARTVLLREFTRDDVTALFKVYGDVDATRHLSFEPRDMDQVQGIVTSAMDSATAEPRTEYMLAVADAESDELVGAARLALGEHQSAQVGFALRPDQWGKGKGAETVRLLEYLGFRKLGLHRLWGARSPLIDASARTMRAAGMIEEGTIRGHLFTRGAWRDSIVHSILAGNTSHSLTTSARKIDPSAAGARSRAGPYVRRLLWKIRASRSRCSSVSGGSASTTCLT